MPPDEGEISRVLAAHRAGEPGAAEKLAPILYDELRKLAAYYMRAERQGHTLQPTALVNEAYLKLAGTAGSFRDRAHFFALAAQVMRHVLVDHARARGTGKRGDGITIVPLDDVVDAIAAHDADLVALDAALAELAQRDPQQGRVVELRYFAGLSIDETAEVLGVSPATVKRDWAMARAWLRRELTPGEP